MGWGKYPGLFRKEPSLKSRGLLGRGGSKGRKGRSLPAGGGAAGCLGLADPRPSTVSRTSCPSVLPDPPDSSGISSGISSSHLADGETEAWGAGGTAQAAQEMGLNWWSLLGRVRIWETGSPERDVSCIHPSLTGCLESVRPCAEHFPLCNPGCDVHAVNVAGSSGLVCVGKTLGIRSAHGNTKQS